VAAIGAGHEPHLAGGSFRRAEGIAVGSKLLDHLDAPGEAVAGQLERLRAQPDDDLGPPLTPAGSASSLPPRRTRPSTTGSVQRFMAGEPMKPATKTLVGWS
jgi:hypothetical protein